MWPAFPNECECRTISNEMIGETGGLRDVTYDKNVENIVGEEENNWWYTDSYRLQVLLYHS